MVEGNPFHNAPNVPRAPQGPAPQYFTGYDEQGNLHKAWIKPGDPLPDWVGRTKIADDPNKPHGREPVSKIVSPQDQAMLRRAMIDLGKNTPGAAQTLWAAQNTIIDRYANDKSIANNDSFKQAIRGLIQLKQKRPELTTDQLIRSIEPAGPDGKPVPLPPKELEILHDLLPILLGQQ